MKKLIAFALACLAMPAFADSVAIAGSGSKSDATSAANSTSTQGNEQNIQFNSPGSVDQKTSGKTKVSTVATIYAPSINTTAPCLVAVSGGVTWVGFGIAGGSAVEDKDCTRREISRILYSIGQPLAAAKVMCSNPEAAKALGSICNEAAPTGQPAQHDASAEGLTPASYQVAEPKIVPQLPDQGAPPMILQPVMN